MELRKILWMKYLHVTDFKQLVYKKFEFLKLNEEEKVNREIVRKQITEMYHIHKQQKNND